MHIIQMHYYIIDKTKCRNHYCTLMQYDTSKQKTMTRNIFEITLTQKKQNGWSTHMICLCIDELQRTHTMKTSPQKTLTNTEQEYAKKIKS